MIIKKATIAILVVAALLTGAHPSGAREVGTIIVPDLRMRSGPGTDYRIIAGLQKGDRVPVLGRENGWLLVEHGGRQGYVVDQDDFVAVSGAPAQAAAEDQVPLKDSSPSAETSRIWIPSAARKRRFWMNSVRRKKPWTAAAGRFERHKRDWPT